MARQDLGSRGEPTRAGSPTAIGLYLCLLLVVVAGGCSMERATLTSGASSPAPGHGLGQALPQLAEIGGSHAQRDLFSQLYLHALQCNGQWASAQNLLQPQCNAQAQSLRLARQMHRVNTALGLPD